LWRFYVDRSRHGQGIASQLMAAVEAAAMERGARTLWLGVWERNPRAVAFYRKYGFERVGEHAFVLGADAQTDWVLARPLGSKERGA
jgi:ribosomal protein S18 acetylase RimI-like enzyme